MGKRKKPTGLEIEDQHCRRPWSDYRALLKLQAQAHSDAENKAARRACRKLIGGDPTWEEIYGSK